MRTTILVVLLLLGSLRAPAAADEIKVMTSGAFTAAYLALKGDFERTSGHTLVTVTTTMGTGENAIPARLKRGEAADVVIVEDGALRTLIADALVLADSRVALVNSSVAMAVRSGAPKPDISSVDGLRQALLAAKSIAISASVSGQYLSNELFAGLGIAEAVKPKVQRIEVERVGTVVARGDAEIGFQQVSELLPIAGIDIVGQLPAAVQRVSTFSAGVAAHSARSELARAFIRYLTSQAVRATITATGLEPLAP